MASVRIGLTTSGSVSRASLLPAHPKAMIVGESGAKVILPLAPSLTHDGLASRYAQFERVGRKPLNRRTGFELRSYAATLLLAGRKNGKLDNQTSVELELQTLRGFGRTGERVQWRNFGPSEGGWFRITSYSVTDVQRQHGTNAICVASVSLTLTEASDAVTNVGPLTGGATKAPATAAPGTAPAPATTAGSQSYTVVSGDTLWKIAVKFYGNGGLYPRIADANKIANPNAISPGQKLTIPPKP